MGNKRYHNRGASLTEYALLVGLISIIALVTVTGIGDNVDDLFGKTGDTLSDVVTNGSGDAAQSPIPSPSPPASVTNLVISDITSQPVSTQVVSDIVQPTVVGTATISITGNGNPELRSCADAACSSVLQSYSGSITIAAGEYLQVRVTTPSSQSTSEVITINAEGAIVTFSVGTGSGDCLGNNSCVFHTSTRYNGNLGGLSGADQICTNDPANPGGPAYAILATNGNNHQRGMTLKTPILRSTDGLQMASTENQFFCNQQLCGNWIRGISAAPISKVWTGVVWIYSGGSTWSGSPTTANCDSWTSSSTGNLGNQASRSADNFTTKPDVWMEGNPALGCHNQYVFTCVNNVQTPPN
ncbi:MAG: hypothetical protein Alpg2KO_14970 [Alphaproteobacteria bacterium]